MSEQPDRQVLREPPGALPSPEHMLDAYRPLVEAFTMAEPMLKVGADMGIFTVSLAGFERPYQGMLAFTEHLTSMGASIGWLVLTSEAWARAIEGPEAEVLADRIQHGDLEQAAELGDSRVGEVVFIVARSATRAGWTLQCPFSRAENGAVAWGEPDIRLLDVDGSTRTPAWSPSPCASCLARVVI